MKKLAQQQRLALLERAFKVQDANPRLSFSQCYLIAVKDHQLLN